jgi:putative hemolysin
LEETRQKIVESAYSRLPVGEGSLDQVAGIVQAKDLLGQAFMNGQLDLQAALIMPQFVPESTEALKVLEMFRESGVHIALVIDEFGGLQGLVTLQDIIEGIVGDLPGEGEAQEPEIIQRGDGSWLMDGSLPVYEFKEILDLSALPQEDRGVYQTLGGFIMSFLGRIPETSDHFDWSGLHFEVMDMDGFRVDKVLVQPINPEDAGPKPDK